MAPRNANMNEVTKVPSNLGNNMKGKTVLVTGATAGIGFHTAALLAAMGARVFVTGRNESRGLEAVSTIRRRAGHEAVDFIMADASSVGGNVSLADQVARRVDQLDVLVNNVGGGPFPNRTETADGFEATLALNFIGPSALTLRLLPLLQSGPTRIVNVVSSSAFHFWKRDPFDDLEARQRYVGIEGHAHAKLLSILFTLSLARRLKETPTVVNPGMAWTPGTAALTPQAVPQWRFVWPIIRWFQRTASAEKAARGPVFLASSSGATFSGRFFEGTAEKALSGRLVDPVLQDRVWQLGESLVAQAGERPGSGSEERKDLA
jgi:NAD(P)-dependent dehydrogenase (short-subunit alcohol dehydrogenase family)